MARSKQVPIRSPSTPKKTFYTIHHEKRPDGSSKRVIAIGAPPLRKTAQDLTKKRHGTQRVVKRPGIDGIAKAALKKITIKGGTKRVSAGAYNDMRRILLAFYVKLVDNCMAYADSAGHTTLSVHDLNCALEKMGHVIYGDPTLIPKNSRYRKRFSIFSSCIQPYAADTKSRLEALLLLPKQTKR